MHPSHCALDSMVDEFPRPLPVDRNALLRDSLTDWGLPLPFCVGLMYDPEHLRRKEEGRVAEEKRLEEERLRLVGLERIRKNILAEERNELQQREILQRAAIALVEPEAWAVLPIIYLEFIEIVALQRFKEQQDRIDLENDQQFFREMQRKQLLPSAGAMSSGQLIAQSIQKKRAKQLHNALRQLKRIIGVETRAREKLAYLYEEESMRCNLKAVEDVNFKLCVLCAEHSLKQLTLIAKETFEYCGCRDREQSERLRIQAGAAAASDTAKRHKYQSRLQHIISQLDGEGQTVVATREAQDVLPSPAPTAPPSMSMRSLSTISLLSGRDWCTSTESSFFSLVMLPGTRKMNSNSSKRKQ